MKRIAIVLLALFMIISGVAPAMAENGYDKKLEEGILKAKEIFNISDEYDKFTSNVNSYDGKTYFYLNWSDSSKKLNYINVNIDIDGNIISYDSYPSVYKENDKKLPNYTRAEAEKIAMEFIGKVSPSIYKEIKPSPDNSITSSIDTQYHLNFNRYVNDIPFLQNSVSISINKYTGDIERYYANWDIDIVFPAPDKIISIDKGKEAFRTEIGIKPMYKTNSYYRPIDTNEEESIYYLAYSILGQSRGIDAFTGKSVNINYYGPYYGIEEKTMDSGEVMGITPAERESIDKLSGLLGEAAAEKKAREALNIDATYKLVSKNLYNSYKNLGEYNWYMYFSKEESKDKFSYFDVGLDAKTGEILNFYKSVDYEAGTKSKINIDKALDIAKEYIKKVQPNKINQIELREDLYQEDNQLRYQFSFIRKDGEIYFESDGIYISIDGVNGDVVSYNLDWFKGDTPPKDKLIPIDKAYQVLWSEIGLELMYIKTYDTTDAKIAEPKMQLVYSLNPNKPVIISGTTGELLDYTGKPYVEYKPISYNDIDKSYAKDKIMTLAEYGIGFKEEEFKPKDKIKQRDFVYLLWKSINQYRIDSLTEDEIYNSFISSGYMTEKEKNPDKIVTKEEAVKYIIKVMRMEKVAEIEEIYKDIFNDHNNISQGLKGYMNIAYGLKIVVGDGKGNINPRYELSREDAANIIYNYMFN